MEHPWTLVMFRLLRYSLRILWGVFLGNLAYLLELITIKEKTRKIMFDIYLHIFI